ncbi:hypothetical protein FOA52_014039 [Chlamydomonas sp. UWO 241]|nr:hypothetical protein FOA52_014039 [Chlamydomonas sp. UWO 241]
MAGCVPLKDPPSQAQLHSRPTPPICYAGLCALGLELLSAAAADVRAREAEPEGGAPPGLGVGRKRKGSSSRYHGVSWQKADSSWQARLWDPQNKREVHIGVFASEEDAARAYDYAVVQAHGPGAKRNFPGEVPSELPVERKKHRGSSRYLGVIWDASRSSWRVMLYDRQTKRNKYIGNFAFEEDAARAYDFAAVQAQGQGAKRNFPGETKRDRHIGCFDSEEDAARAYDYAAGQMQGPGTKLNFEAEVVSEQPVSKGEGRKQRNSSSFLGVSWKHREKSVSSWDVQLWDPQAKRCLHIGSFASEEDAARAYDYAAVQAHGPGAKRNFPGEVISEMPEERKKQQRSSRYLGVGWSKADSVWKVQVYDPQTKRSKHIGYFASEEDAARAYDYAVVKVVAVPPQVVPVLQVVTMSLQAAPVGQTWVREEEQQQAGAR